MDEKDPVLMTKHTPHDNTLSDVSKKEQICCRDNAPDEQDLFFPPVYPKNPGQEDAESQPEIRTRQGTPSNMTP